MTDIRWKQRFANYKKAYSRLKNSAAFFEAKLGEAEENIAMEALIKCFELTYELAWQTMKDYISYKGFDKNIQGSRDSIRAAQQFNLIANGQIWMDMINDRNRASHAYDEDDAKCIATRIISLYYCEFAEFEIKMDAIP